VPFTYRCEFYQYGRLGVMRVLWRPLWQIPPLTAYRQSKGQWATTYKFAFGQTKLGDQSVRKGDDKIDVETLLTYKIGGRINPYAAGTLKTQFAEGFKYDENDVGTQISKTFDPAYFTQSVGVGIQPLAEFRTRIGFALREIVTRDFTNFTDNGETPEIEKTKVNGGMEWVTDVKWSLKDNIVFTSKLELFSAFSNFTDAVVQNNSNLAFKLSKYITVNFKTEVISDTTASPKVQLKETLALGLNYTFF